MGMNGMGYRDLNGICVDRHGIATIVMRFV